MQFDWFKNLTPLNAKFILMQLGKYKITYKLFVEQTLL